MVNILPGYKTIENNGFYEETEKRSKFISYSFPVNSQSQIQKHLKEVKSKHWDARHHVYAYSLAEDFSEKYSDDGEPSGTAGLPIINVIKSLGLYNVLVVVVRYFGGILLGTGGLRKMYGSGAKEALLNAGIVEANLCTEISLGVDYKEYGKILAIVTEHKSKIISMNYLNDINLNFYIKKSDLEVITKKISDILKGNEKIKIVGESYQIV